MYLYINPRELASPSIAFIQEWIDHTVQLIRNYDRTGDAAPCWFLAGQLRMVLANNTPEVEDNLDIIEEVNSILNKYAVRDQQPIVFEKGK